MEKLLKRVLGRVLEGTVEGARAAVARELDEARGSERGRAALQNATVAAGVPYVAQARSPREALERLTVVVDAAWNARGDRR